MVWRKKVNLSFDVDWTDWLILVQNEGRTLFWKRKNKDRPVTQLLCIVSLLHFRTVRLDLIRTIFTSKSLLYFCFV